MGTAIAMAAVAPLIAVPDRYGINDLDEILAVFVPQSPHWAP
jgi:hypothetical protein